MPQMKPMNWMLLFTFLCIIMLMMNINNYFNKNNSILFNKKKMSNYKISWKW